MSENLGYFFGFLVGLIFAVAATVIWNYMQKKRGTAQAEYDERQVLARGTAFRISFFAAMLYMIVCALAAVLEIQWAEVSVQMFFGVFFLAAVFMPICIVKDAYFVFTSKVKHTVIVFLFVVLANIFVVIMNIAEGESFLTNNMLNLHCINIGASVAFTIPLITILIKKAKDKRTDEIEE